MDYKTYRWKWNNLFKLQFVEKVPIHLDLELNTNCNYSCIMCPFHGNRDVKNIKMPFYMVKKIIDEFVDKGGGAIKFVYRGEPLLYKDLVKVIRYAKSKGVLDTRLNTNGMLLNSSLSSDLILYGLDLITFSVDSCRPEIYEKIRRGGKLDTVIQNILLLNLLKKSYMKNNPKIVVQCLEQELNKCELENNIFHKFWSFVDKVEINPNCMDHENTEVFGETPDFRCKSIWQRLTIRANGDIALCCGIDSDNKIFGNIKDNTIEEIWTGKEMTNIRKLMNEGNSHLIPACRTCDVRRKFYKGELK